MITPPIELEELVPHRRPMLLLSRIVSFDDQSASTHSIVEAHWPMIVAEGANALILIELVAQTAAVNNGWELLQHEGPRADSRGWIVGIKSATIEVDLIPIGTQIEVESVNQFAYDNFREIRGIAKVEGRQVAEVTLQLMRAEPFPNSKGQG